MDRTNALGGLQVFIAGNALSDPIDVMAGRLGGLEDNLALLDNLVAMTEDATASPPYSKQVHDAFSQMERILGKFVDEGIRTLKRTSTPQKYFRATVLQNIKDKATGRIEFRRCGYWDIVEIMRFNSQIFAPFMRPVAGSDFIGFLKVLNAAQRLLLAHPHKAEQDGKVFTEADVAAVRARLVATRKAYSEFLGNVPIDVEIG